MSALRDPPLRSIVERVSCGRVSVCALAKPLKLTLAAVAQHIQVLEASGLLQTEKLYHTRTCTLNTKEFKVANK